MAGDSDRAAGGGAAISEIVHATILGSMNDAVYVRDLERKLLYVNPAAERLTGWSLDEALAQPCYKTFGDPGEACNRMCPIDRCISLGQSVQHQQGRLVCRDGRVLDMRVSIAPLMDGGSVIGSVVVLQDLSELRDIEHSHLKTLMALEEAEARLHVSEERFKDFAEAASDWLWETDDKLRFTEISGLPPLGPGLDVLLSIGKTREELADTDDDPEKWRRHRADIEARRPYSNFQYRRVDENGKVTRLRVSGTPLFDDAGNFLGYRGVGSDITALVDAERQARSAQERLAAALDGIPASIVLYDGEDKLIIANRACRELNEAIVHTLRPGSRFEDRMRAALRVGLYADAIGREEAWLRERLEQHRDPSGPVEVARQDGRHFLVHEQRLDDGGTLTIATDITELKLAQAAAARSQRQLALHLENTPMAATAWDTDLICTSWNRAAETIFGYTAEETVGHPSVDLLVPEAIRDEVRGLLAAVMAGGDERPRQRVNQNLTKDGRIITCEWFNTPLLDDDGTIVGVAALARDVTDKMKAEEELRLAKESADQANWAKSDFLSSMSHELRTPLNGILGFAQLLDLGGDTPLDQEQRQFVGHIIRSGHHLLSLINDVLDLSKIEAGKIDLVLEDVAVEAALAECVELVELDARARGIEISIPEAASVPLLVHADATRVRQALLNLLSNAVKYNKDGGRVTVSFAAPSSAMLRVSVADTGHGIAEARRGDVFQPFSRLDAERSDVEGTGIGLTVTKRIIEKMGGRIDFESEVGVGSTFWIELPVAGES